MSEENVGIQEFLSYENETINATIKFRITDFIVEEISLDGKICKVPKESFYELEKILTTTNAQNKKINEAFNGKQD
jgi:hypothetical protein